MDQGSLITGTFYGVVDALDGSFKNGVVEQHEVYTDPLDIPDIDISLIEKTITANGTYSAEDDGYVGYSDVVVNVPLPQNAYLLKSVANLPQAIASFNDGQEMVMPSLKVAIEPQQEGSGDPGPTNVRPISGWDECNVTRTGKNLFDESILLKCSGWAVSDGVYSGDSAQVHAKYNNGVPNLAFKPNTQYTFSFTYGQDGSDGVGLTVIIRYTDDTATQKNCTLDSVGFVSVNSAAGKNIKKLELSYRANRTIHLSNMQLEEGSIATTYEPYAGTTYEIDLDGIRYGGTLDVVGGVLTVDRASVDLSSVTASYNIDWNCWTIQPSVLQNAKIIASDNTPTTAMTDRFKAVKASGYTAAHESGTIAQNTSGIWFIDNGSTTELSGQLVYELATPLTIQLAPTAIKSLCDVNNVYANTGNIKDAEYFSKEM